MGRSSTCCRAPLWRLLREQDRSRAGSTAQVSWAETGTPSWLARKHGDIVINNAARATRLPIGVHPAQDTDRALAVTTAAFPAVERCEDALSVALMNAGPITTRYRKDVLARLFGMLGYRSEIVRPEPRHTFEGVAWSPRAIGSYVRWRGPCAALV